MQDPPQPAHQAAHHRRVHAHENPPAVPPAKDQLPVPGAIPEPKMDIEVGVPKPKMHGVIVGHGLAHFRYHDKNGQMVEEVALAHGDNVILTTAGGEDLKPVWGSFYVTDYLKTEMSEYDSSYVYVPLDQLQRIRGMADRLRSKLPGRFGPRFFSLGFRYFRPEPPGKRLSGNILDI